MTSTSGLTGAKLISISKISSLRLIVVRNLPPVMQPKCRKCAMIYSREMSLCLLIHVVLETAMLLNTVCTAMLQFALLCYWILLGGKLKARPGWLGACRLAFKYQEKRGNVQKNFTAPRSLEGNICQKYLHRQQHHRHPQQDLDISSSVLQCRLILSSHCLWKGALVGMCKFHLKFSLDFWPF